MEYAGVSLRFVAVLIDAIILLVLILVLALFTGGWYSTTTENAVHAVGVNADSWPLLVFFGYYIILEAVSGRTSFIKATAARRPGCEHIRHLRSGRASGARKSRAGGARAAATCDSRG